MDDFNTTYDKFGVNRAILGPLSSLDNQVTNVVSPANFNSSQSNSQVSVVAGFYQSSNFVSGLVGWQIQANGDVKFGIEESDIATNPLKLNLTSFDMARLSLKSSRATVYLP